MLEAKNERRRAKGLPEVTEEDYRAQLAREGLARLQAKPGGET